MLKKYIIALALLAAFSNSAMSQVIPSGAGAIIVYHNGGGSSGGGAVASVTGGNSVLCNPTTGSVVCSSTATLNQQVGTSYPTVSTDGGKLVTLNNASPVAVSLSQANTAGFTSGFEVEYQNLGAGTVTITPTTSQINGGANITLAQYDDVLVWSDSSNYFAIKVPASLSSGFPITIGSTSIASGSTTTTIAGLTLTAPALGAATATTINKVTITQPATGATLTIPDGVTLNAGAGGTLGTASVQNTGTSGGNVPLLNGTNTWSATQAFNSITIAGGQAIQLNSGKMAVGTKPSVTSGAGTSPSVAGNYSGGFIVTVGATGSPSSAIVLGMPTAASNWICTASDITNNALTGYTTALGGINAVTVTFYTHTTGVATAPAASDQLAFMCLGE